MISLMTQGHQYKHQLLCNILIEWCPQGLLRHFGLFASILVFFFYTTFLHFLINLFCTCYTFNVFCLLFSFSAYSVGGWLFPIMFLLSFDNFCFCFYQQPLFSQLYFQTSCLLLFWKPYLSLIELCVVRIWKLWLGLTICLISQMHVFQCIDCHIWISQTSASSRFLAIFQIDSGSLS